MATAHGLRLETQAAIRRLINEHGQDKTEKMVMLLNKVIKRPYAPKIITPLELERDLGKLKAFVEQEMSRTESKSLKNKIGYVS